MLASSTPAHSLPRQILLGFLAGALAVLAFHQVMVLILSSVGLVQATPYAMRPVPPLGVPTILNSMFWGGLWGVVFALVAGRVAGGSPTWPKLILAGLAFGLLGPLLANWFVVSPIKGQPIAAGWAPQRMLSGVLIAGAFGIGTTVIHAALLRVTAGRRSAPLPAARL